MVLFMQKQVVLNISLGLIHLLDLLFCCRLIIVICNGLICWHFWRRKLILCWQWSLCLLIHLFLKFSSPLVFAPLSDSILMCSVAFMVWLMYEKVYGQCCFAFSYRLQTFCLTWFFIVCQTCFFRQFGRSVVRADYLTLRKGFIMVHRVDVDYEAF